MSSGWPSVLWLVRHGESLGNLARTAAEDAARTDITIEGRDIDVPLSPLGERQSRALGAWFGLRDEPDRPSVVLSSPYMRARQTARLIAEEAGLALAGPIIADERLREKEFGALNRLTAAGIRNSYPEEARRRTEIGKFYYGPPGGESWCDVILRLRSLLDQLQLRHADERVLLVAHQVVVLCFRYLLEDLDEAQLLEIDHAADVANCSVTTFYASAQKAHLRMRLENYNFVAPIQSSGAPVTSAPDIAVKK